MSLRVAPHQLAVKHSAVLRVARDAGLVHVRKRISCTVRSRVTKREHPLGAARVRRLVQMTMLQIKTELKVVFSARPDGVIFERNDRAPIKKIGRASCRERV